ncbi:MAG: HupE / UreJ protein [Ferruginibacter sp.]|nr:HupE / UreJ protein [Ferruginibacter sp.]
MNDFAFYFDLGWQHIISWDALDHLLFLTALTAIYLAENWKQVLVLVTAFTIGHSLTLALSVFDIIRFNSAWVEFFIPVTIVITALLNFRKRTDGKRVLRFNYFLALCFGLIHGMGFANTIRFMLARKQAILTPLLSFNLGLEAGQILVVTGILLLSFILVNKAGLPQRFWRAGLSAIALIIAAIMCVQRWPL